MKTAARLTITPLEDRTVPAGFGNAWVDTNLTVSFVPDGTDVDGAPSSLFRTLGARATTAEWQGAIKAAFQTWAVPTNLNVSFVGDDGRPLGTPGPVQGSPFVGDIRVSARPLCNSVLAIANPFDLVSAWAGEIVLNSNKLFDTDGSADANDLYSVLMHEAGHALGVPHSTDPASAMQNRHTRVTALAPGDVAAIQALYGAREQDRFDANNSNDTLINASWLYYLRSVEQLAGTDGTQGAQPFVAAGDLTTATDIDSYGVFVPTTHTNPTVVVETAGLSSVRLRVSVWYRATGPGGNSGILMAASSTPDANGNYVVPFTPLPGLSAYYVKVEAAPGAGPFAVGAYKLAVGNALTAISASQYSMKLTTPGGTVTGSDNGTTGKGANDTTATATSLGQARDGTDQRWDYRGVASLGAATDVDVYRVRTTAKSGSVLVVNVGTAPGGASPSVTVLDSKGNPVPAEVLVQNGDAVLIQIQGVKANATYFVSVRSADTTRWTAPEGYQIGIDFRATPIALDPFADGTLTQAQNQIARALQVTNSTLFRLQLSANSATDTAPTAARLTVFDAAGTAVFTLVARSGQTVLGDILLPPGAYTVVITGATRDGSPLKGLAVDARLMALTDPVGPSLADDYGISTTTTTAKTTTTTNATTATTTDPGFYWLAPAAIGSGFLDPTSVYSSPWW